MTLLLGAGDLPSRRAAAAGSLAPLAASLRADLGPLLDSAAIWYPAEKARLTKRGGRCPEDGVLLEFDPWSPRLHRCPSCGSRYGDEEHYRWWIMNYQLWLAERSVHAATLALVTGDAACRGLAERILDGYADRYLGYPNRDNVLGPSRPFFSTYLESIWLLQLAVATSLLELETGAGAIGARVRDRIIEPSAALIVEYHEGDSNRQVWNCAACAAAYRMLGMAPAFEDAMVGQTGLSGLLERGLLSDGTWYEGENYHLFAHRGFWYSARMAAVAGLDLSARARARFADGFVTPFLTALPDFTFPSRRDSQYRVSLRQWRIAESCELGLAEPEGGQRLLGPLRTLYAADLPPGDTGRAVSTAEAERHVAPCALSRASLGWKSLLRARPVLPAATEWQLRSAQLPAQGWTVFRRDAGRCFVALDYGTSGGGHGHPDRLNLWFVHGEARFLEDVGTGSYVDTTLFWYRSTLAHNAPMLDGASQPWRDGRLVAYEEIASDQIGWVVAEFPIAPGRLVVRRRVIVMPGYFIDQLEWEGTGEASVDLPVHVDPDRTEPSSSTFHLVPGDGFRAQPGSGAEFVTQAERLAGALSAWEVPGEGRRARAWVDCSTAHEWWRLRAPGPPTYASAGAGRGGEQRFLVCRAGSTPGRLTQVWTWSDAIVGARLRDTIEVDHRDGGRDIHQLIGGRWQIVRREGTVRLDGHVESARDAAAPAMSRDRADVTAMPSTAHIALREGQELCYELGEANYRRTEEPWSVAGAPTATVRVSYLNERVHLVADVHKSGVTFAPPRSDNALDNEHPDINSDGLQLYFARPAWRFYGSWILVPEPPGSAVRVTPRAGDAASLPVEASWAATSTGYRLQLSLDIAHAPEPPTHGPTRSSSATSSPHPRSSPPIDPLAASPPPVADRVFCLDVAINEMSSERERRRGQLVLSGGRGEWLYLHGDREDPNRMLLFAIQPDE